MGLIKAAAASVNSMAKDQWKEFFYRDSIPEDQIMVRAYKHQSAQSANSGSDDVITDGSIIAVADGQCAIVVSNGKVIAIFMEPGENEFRTGDTYGIFSGSSAGKMLKEMGRRFSFGGDAPAIVHRVYYLNTKVITGNRFGRGNSIPIRVLDEERGIDIDCSLIMAGVYSFRVVDPEKIYKRVIGNVKQVYPVSYLISQMGGVIDNTLLMVAGNICKDGTRPYRLGSFMPQISEEIKDTANETLRDTLGIEIVSIAFDNFGLTDADTGIVRQIQVVSIAKDPLMAAAMLSEAQAEAMVEAASNVPGGQ